MGNKQGSLSNHLETASKTGALAFPGKVRKLFYYVIFLCRSLHKKEQKIIIKRHHA